MVLRPGGGEPDLDAAHFVAPHLLAGGADDNRGLNPWTPQNVAWRDDTHAPAHARKASPVVGLRPIARCKYSIIVLAPAVPIEQAFDACADVHGQVVLGDYALLGHDELPLLHRVGIDLGMPRKRKPLACSQVTDATLAVKGLGHVLEACHMRISQRAQVQRRVAEVWRRDIIGLQARRERISTLTLVHLGRCLRLHQWRPIGIPVIPAVHRRPAGLQVALRAPIGNGIPLFGRRVPVEAHGPGCVLSKTMRVVEEDQGVADGIVRLLVRRSFPAGQARPKEPGDAAPLHQAPKEDCVRFVVLHDEFARWELTVQQACIDVQVEGRCQDGIISPPFRDDRLDDVQLAHVSEDARIHAVFHDG